MILWIKSIKLACLRACVFVLLKKEWKKLEEEKEEGEGETR